MKNKSIRYVAKNSESFLLKRMCNERADGFIKRGTFTNEIVWGNYSYIIPQMDKKKQTSFKKGMFLFGMVRKDVKEYLKKNKGVYLPKRYGQMEYNSNEVLSGISKKITGTDLNHAYWRIALNLGIITEYTYNKGLPDEFKSVRLAALSTMGSDKKYQKIIDGELTDEAMVIEGDKEFKKVYTLIRYTCYKYMADLRKILAEDFICYKTDCIYYVDKAKNRKIVTDFFSQKNLLMKQLE